MSIQLYSLKSPPVTPVAGTRAVAGSRARTAAPETKRTVAISAAARQLASRATDEDVDVARVEAIRAALAAGTLRIDTSRIADGLIASARELVAQDTPQHTP